MGNSFRQTLASIFSDKRMDNDLLLEGHVFNTLERVSASEGSYILVVQDTSYYNYSGHKSKEGLGQIQGNVRGVIQHNTLVLSEKGLPLGILHQQYWTRAGGKNFVGKESEKWLRGLEAVNQYLGKESRPVINISDRESDIFNFFKAPRCGSVELLVRVYQPRNIEIVASGQGCKLAEVSDYLQDFGKQEVEIERKGRTVRLTLQLRAGQVHILPDKDLSPAKHKLRDVSLIIAQEVACVDTQTGENVFEASEAALWYLMSTMPVKEKSDVERMVYFYSLRWRIERFHYTLKSGALNVEKLQFDDIHTLVNALTFYSIVAWQLLATTYYLRQVPQAPASDVFEKEEIELMEQVSKKKIRTIGEMVLELGKMVGFARSKKQPWPGVKVMASALEKLFYMKLGFLASKEKPLQD